MHQKREKLPDKARHHYLFYIFQKDKENNRMPERRAKRLFKFFQKTMK